LAEFSGGEAEVEAVRLVNNGVSGPLLLTPKW